MLSFPSGRWIKKLARILQGNLASECIPVPRFLQDSCKFFDSLARILQAYRFILQDSCKFFDSSCKSACKMNRKACKMNKKNCKNLASFSIQMLGKGGQRRKGADFCSSKLVLAFAWAFLTSLTTTDGALLCSRRSAPWPSRQRKKQRP